MLAQIVSLALGDRVSRPVRLARYAVLVVVVALLGLLAGKDANWDLKNYHYYIPYAFLEGRMGQDIGPSQMHTFFNPLLDVPFYLAATWFNGAPLFVGFLLCLPYGVCVALTLFMARMLFPIAPEAGWRAGAGQHLKRYVAVLLGSTGAAGLSVIGTATGDVPSTLLMLAALAMGLVYLRGTKRPLLVMALLGLLVGVAAPLKLSYAPHALAIGVAVAWMTLWRRVRGLDFLASGVGALAGFAAVGLPWMVNLTMRFGSPLFPMMNDKLHSPWAKDFDYVDRRFQPHGLLDYLTRPFDWGLGDGRAGSEIAYHDPRAMLLMAFAAVAALAFGLRTAEGLLFRREQAPAGRFKPGMPTFLSVYLLVGYVVWLMLYGVMRYTVPMEFVVGLLLVHFAAMLASAAARPAALASMAAGLVAVTTVPNWGRAPYGNVYVDAAPPELPEGSLVMMFGGIPNAYVIPFFKPKSLRFIGIDTTYFTSDDRNRQYDNLKDIFARQTAPVFELRLHDYQQPKNPLVESFGYVLDPNTCQRFDSSYGDKFEICRMTKTAPAPA